MCSYPDDHCQNDGVCIEVNDGSISCECPSAYIGEFCDIDACEVIKWEDGFTDDNDIFNREHRNQCLI